MTMNEFTNLTNLTPSFEEFNQIHAEYIVSGLDKQQFCLELLQSTTATKSEQKQTLKFMKENLKMDIADLKAGDTRTMENKTYNVVMTNGTMITVYDGMNTEELKNIKFTQIIYIAEMGEDVRDSISGNITNIYYNVEDTNNMGLVQLHIEKNIQRVI